MDAKTADGAMGELVEHIAGGRSLLAWTMSWCPDGERDWEAIWNAATDAKAMINVLVSVGAVRGARVRTAPYIVGTPREDGVFELVIDRAGEPAITRSARTSELSSVVRMEIPRPPLRRIVAGTHTRD